MNRNQNIQRLQTETFDLCIIGGGASGAGCALDAALRGLKVALVEKDDFAAGTSSRSTKLVHGGVRYLEQAFKNFDFAQLRQVRHGLEERHIVLQNAPHLARPLALITPVFSWWEKLYFSIGLTLYDWFASGKDNLPKSRRLSKNETLRMLPGLSDRISGAVMYYDGQMDDARYCLALVQSAAEAGAVVANYLESTDFQKDGNGLVTGVHVALRAPAEEGIQPFLIRSRLVLNCSGAHADQVRLLANPALPHRIRPSKGVHVVLPRHILGSGEEALLIPKTRDGRMVFAVPFEGALLLGTTDNDYTELEKEPALEAGETTFLLETLQPFLREKVDKSQVKAGFGGLRPLIQSTQPSNPPTSKPSNLPTFKPSKSLVRDHEVEHEPMSNLLSLLGGKWTTYRLMAKDAVDAACALLGIAATCRTENYPLSGARGWERDLWKKIQAEYGFETDISQHLARKYGARSVEVATLAARVPELSERLLAGHPFLKAEVVHAVHSEMALTVRDFLARRIRLEIADWQAAQDVTPVVAGIMGREMGWTEQEQSRQVQAYVSLLEDFRKKAAGVLPDRED